MRKYLWKPKWERGTPVGPSQVGADEWRLTHCVRAVHCVRHHLAMLHTVLPWTSPLHQHCSNTSFISMHPSICFYLSFSLPCSYLTPPDKPLCLLLETLPPWVPFPATLNKFGHLFLCCLQCIWHDRMPNTVLDIGNRTKIKIFALLVLSFYFGRKIVGK